MNRSLSGLHSQRELENLTRIIWEDVFKNENPEKPKIKLEVIISRMQNKEPIQYILQEADFYGLKFRVDPSVLIPRPETEELVHLCIEHEKKRNSAFEILDIGTGSGCIAISLAKELPLAELSAWDISSAALAIAKENANRNEVAISFSLKDFTNKINWKTSDLFDVIVSNPPYIGLEERGNLDKSVLEFEPDLALFSPTQDALLFYRLIHIFSFNHLRKGGRIYLELNEYNAGDVLQIFGEYGFIELQLVKDMQGKERILFGVKDTV